MECLSTQRGTLSFVIDAYTKRLFERLYGKGGSYEELKSCVEKNIPKNLTIYKEFHALIDRHGQTHCKSIPRCGGCILKSFCLSAIPSF